VGWLGIEVSIFDRIRQALVGRRPGPGQTPVYVSDPRFEGWDAVREFGDLRTARAWHQALTEAGIDAALTADWPVDRYGRGEIWLCVQPEDWSEAELLLSNLDPD
jgi:hypothetical protein